MQNSLFGIEFMHLLDMDCETTSGIKTPRTMATFKVLGFLMLHQDYNGINLVKASQQNAHLFHPRIHVRSTSTMVAIPVYGVRNTQLQRRLQNQTHKLVFLLVLVFPHGWRRDATNGHVIIDDAD